MDLRKVRTLSNILMAGVVLCFVLNMLFRSNKTLSWVFIGLMILLTVVWSVVRILYWRCPYCKRILGPEKDIEDCPYCGEKIILPKKQ